MPPVRDGAPLTAGAFGKAVSRTVSRPMRRPRVRARRRDPRPLRAPEGRLRHSRPPRIVPPRRRRTIACRLGADAGHRDVIRWRSRGPPRARVALSHPDACGHPDSTWWNSSAQSRFAACRFPRPVQRDTRERTGQTGLGDRAGAHCLTAMHCLRRRPKRTGTDSREQGRRAEGDRTTVGSAGLGPAM